MNATLEVADVFRDGEDRFRARYGKTLSPGQHQVLRAVLRCRTAALGGHVQRCDDCGTNRFNTTLAVTAIVPSIWEPGSAV